MKQQHSRDKHYKKINLKRRARIAVRKIIYTCFTVLALGIAGFASYNPELANQQFKTYVNQLSSKTGFALRQVEVNEVCHYCTSAKPILKTIQPGTSIFLIDIEDIRSQLEQQSCIKAAKIRRHYPDIIVIEIIEQKPIAIWQNNQQFFYITEEDKIMPIKTLNDIESFIIVTGNNAPSNTSDLISFLELDKEYKDRVISATWIGNRRWNVKLKEGLTVALPEDNPEIAWNKFIKMSKNPTFIEKNYSLVDFRIPDRIYTK